MWNLFEKKACDASFTIPKIERLIHANNFNIEVFREVIEYFRNRYITDGHTNEYFTSLRLRPPDRPADVRDFLLGIEERNEKLILACAIIIYRFRNNLFHGEKEIRNIHLQVENFHTANFFLAKFLEAVNL